MAQAAFPELAFREAYTSRIVIRRLKARGIEKQTPLEALFALRAEGFTRVIVQSSTLLEGAEMESLRRDVASVEGFFREIRIGTPLLYDVEDCRKVVDILATRHADAADGKQKAHVVLVGHGTYTPATATYSQIDYMFSAQGHPLFHVGTLEGYPTFETLLDKLKEAKARRVTLVPLLFVAGDHATNDIAVEWTKALEHAPGHAGRTPARRPGRDSRNPGYLHRTYPPFPGPRTRGYYETERGVCRRQGIAFRQSAEEFKKTVYLQERDVP